MAGKFILKASHRVMKNVKCRRYHTVGRIRCSMSPGISNATSKANVSANIKDRFLVKRSGLHPRARGSKCTRIRCSRRPVRSIERTGTYWQEGLGSLVTSLVAPSKFWWPSNQVRISLEYFWNLEFQKYTNSDPFQWTLELSESELEWKQSLP